MPTHIEHVVTDVITEPTPRTAAGEASAADQRWNEQQKMQAERKRMERYSSRLSAECFDD